MACTWPDNDSTTGLDKTDSYRLTISVDRPTFVNFLNANRTFFFNTQWFFEYEPSYHLGYLNNGAWDMFGVFSVSTGYMQDRLLPSLVLVYFVMNNSFAVLPEITYRFTENFSVTFGLAAFAGREETRPMPTNELAISTERFRPRRLQVVGGERPGRDPRARRGVPAHQVHVLASPAPVSRERPGRRALRLREEMGDGGSGPCAFPARRQWRIHLPFGSVLVTGAEMGLAPRRYSTDRRARMPRAI